MHFEKVIFKIEAKILAVPDDDLVDNLDRSHQGQLMILWDRGAPLLMLPKHFVGGKGNREVVTECARFFEKLNMSSVKNVVAARNKDFLINKECQL